MPPEITPTDLALAAKFLIAFALRQQSYIEDYEKGIANVINRFTNTDQLELAGLFAKVRNAK